MAEEQQAGPLQSIGIDLSVEASESFIKELDASGTSLRNLGGDLVTFTDNAKAFNAALLRMGTTIGLVNQSLGKTNKLATSIKALSEVAATSEKMRASAADAATSINSQARAIGNLTDSIKGLRQQGVDIDLSKVVVGGSKGSLSADKLFKNQDKLRSNLQARLETEMKDVDLSKGGDYLANEMRKALKRAAQQMAGSGTLDEAGQQLVEGLAKAADNIEKGWDKPMKEAEASAANGAKALAHAYLNALDTSFGMASPSKEMIKRGRNLIAGLIVGERSGRDALRKSARDSAQVYMLEFSASLSRLGGQAWKAFASERGEMNLGRFGVSGVGTGGSKGGGKKGGGGLDDDVNFTMDDVSEMPFDKLEKTLEDLVPVVEANQQHAKKIRETREKVAKIDARQAAEQKKILDAAQAQGRTWTIQQAIPSQAHSLRNRLFAAQEMPAWARFELVRSLVGVSGFNPDTSADSTSWGGYGSQTKRTADKYGVVDPFKNVIPTSVRKGAGQSMGHTAFNISFSSPTYQDLMRQAYEQGGLTEDWIISQVNSDLSGAIDQYYSPATKPMKWGNLEAPVKGSYRQADMEGEFRDLAQRAAETVFQQLQIPLDDARGVLDALTADGPDGESAAAKSIRTWAGLNGGELKSAAGKKGDLGNDVVRFLKDTMRRRAKQQQRIEAGVEPFVYSGVSEEFVRYRKILTSSDTLTDTISNLIAFDKDLKKFYRDKAREANEQLGKLQAEGRTADDPQVQEAENKIKFYGKLANRQDPYAQERIRVLRQTRADVEKAAAQKMVALQEELKAITEGRGEAFIDKRGRATQARINAQIAANKMRMSEAQATLDRFAGQEVSGQDQIDVLGARDVIKDLTAANASLERAAGRAMHDMEVDIMNIDNGSRAKQIQGEIKAIQDKANAQYAKLDEQMASISAAAIADPVLRNAANVARRLQRDAPHLEDAVLRDKLIMATRATGESDTKLNLSGQSRMWQEVQYTGDLKNLFPSMEGAIPVDEMFPDFLSRFDEDVKNVGDAVEAYWKDKVNRAREAVRMVGDQDYAGRLMALYASNSSKENAGQRRALRDVLASTEQGVDYQQAAQNASRTLGRYDEYLQALANDPNNEDIKTSLSIVEKELFGTEGWMKKLQWFMVMAEEQANILIAEARSGSMLSLTQRDIQRMSGDPQDERAQAVISPLRADRLRMAQQVPTVQTGWEPVSAILGEASIRDEMIKTPHDAMVAVNRLLDHLGQQLEVATVEYINQYGEADFESLRKLMQGNVPMEHIPDKGKFMAGLQQRISELGEYSEQLYSQALADDRARNEKRFKAIGPVSYTDMDKAARLAEEQGKAEEALRLKLDAANTERADIVAGIRELETALANGLVSEEAYRAGLRAFYSRLDGPGGVNAQIADLARKLNLAATEARKGMEVKAPPVTEAPRGSIEDRGTEIRDRIAELRKQQRAITAEAAAYIRTQAVAGPEADAAAMTGTLNALAKEFALINQAIAVESQRLKNFYVTTRPRREALEMTAEAGINNIGGNALIKRPIGSDTSVFLDKQRIEEARQIYYARQGMAAGQVRSDLDGGYEQIRGIGDVGRFSADFVQNIDMVVQQFYDVIASGFARAGKDLGKSFMSLNPELLTQPIIEQLRHVAEFEPEKLEQELSRSIVAADWKLPMESFFGKDGFIGKYIENVTTTINGALLAAAANGELGEKELHALQQRLSDSLALVQEHLMHIEEDAHNVRGFADVRNFVDDLIQIPVEINAVATEMISAFEAAAAISREAVQSADELGDSAKAMAQETEQTAQETKQATEQATTATQGATAAAAGAAPSAAAGAVAGVATGKGTASAAAVVAAIRELQAAMEASIKWSVDALTRFWAGMVQAQGAFAAATGGAGSGRGGGRNVIDDETFKGLQRAAIKEAAAGGRTAILGVRQAAFAANKRPEDAQWQRELGDVLSQTLQDYIRNMRTAVSQATDPKDLYNQAKIVRADFEEAMNAIRIAFRLEDLAKDTRTAELRFATLRDDKLSSANVARTAAEGRVRNLGLQPQEMQDALDRIATSFTVFERRLDIAAGETTGTIEDFRLRSGSALKDLRNSMAADYNALRQALRTSGDVGTRGEEVERSIPGRARNLSKYISKAEKIGVDPAVLQPLRDQADQILADFQVEFDRIRTLGLDKTKQDTMHIELGRKVRDQLDAIRDQARESVSAMRDAEKESKNVDRMLEKMSDTQLKFFSDSEGGYARLRADLEEMPYLQGGIKERLFGRMDAEQVATRDLFGSYMGPLAGAAKSNDVDLFKQIMGNMAGVSRMMDANQKRMAVSVGLVARMRDAQDSMYGWTQGRKGAIGDFLGEDYLPAKSRAKYGKQIAKDYQVQYQEVDRVIARMQQAVLDGNKIAFSTNADNLKRILDRTVVEASDAARRIQDRFDAVNRTVASTKKWEQIRSDPRAYLQERLIGQAKGTGIGGWLARRQIGAQETIAATAAQKEILKYQVSGIRRFFGLLWSPVKYTASAAAASAAIAKGGAEKAVEMKRYGAATPSAFAGADAKVMQMYASAQDGGKAAVDKLSKDIGISAKKLAMGYQQGAINLTKSQAKKITQIAGKEGVAAGAAMSRGMAVGAKSGEKKVASSLFGKFKGDVGTGIGLGFGMSFAHGIINAIQSMAWRIQSTISGIFREGFTSAMEMEMTRMSFQAMTAREQSEATGRSTAAVWEEANALAADQLDMINKMAKVSSFGRTPLIEGYKGLRAAEYTESDARALMQTITNWSDVYAPGQQQVLDTFATQLGQMRTTGILQMQDLRPLQQTANIPVLRYIAQYYQEISDDTGEATGELRYANQYMANKTEALKQIAEDMSDGKIGATSTVRAIVEGLQKDTEGMEGKGATTLTGLLSTFSDIRSLRMEDFVSPLMEGGLKPFLEWINEIADSPAVIGAFQSAGEQAFTVIAGAMEVLVQVLGTLKGLWDSLPTGVQELAKWGVAFAGILSAITVFLTAVSVVGPTVAAIFGGMGGHITLFTTTIAGFMATIGKVFPEQMKAIGESISSPWETAAEKAEKAKEDMTAGDAYVQDQQRQERERIFPSLKAEYGPREQRWASSAFLQPERFEPSKIFQPGMNPPEMMRNDVPRVYNQQIGPLTKQQLETEAAAYGDWRDSIINAVSGVWETMQGFFGEIHAFLSGGASAIGEWWYGMVEQISTDFIGFLDGIYRYVYDTFGGIGNFLSTNVLPGIGQFVQGFMDALANIPQFLSDLVTNVWDWGRGIMEAFAAGLQAGADVIVQFFTWLGDLFSEWMEPHSPPKFLPDLENWGTAAADAYLSGWTKVDFSTMNTLTSKLEEALQLDEGGLEESQISAIRKGVAATIDAATKGIATNSFVLDAIPGWGGRAEQVARLTQAYAQLAVVQHKQAVEQQYLDQVTRKYDAILKPLEARLKSFQDQQEALDLTDQIKEYERVIANVYATDKQKQSAQLKLDELKLQEQINNLEMERNAITDPINNRLAKLAEEEATAQNILDITEARWDAEIGMMKAGQQKTGADGGADSAAAKEKEQGEGKDRQFTAPNLNLPKINIPDSMSKIGERLGKIAEDVKAKFKPITDAANEMGTAIGTVTGQVGPMYDAFKKGLDDGTFATEGGVVGFMQNLGVAAGVTETAIGNVITKLGELWDSLTRSWTFGPFAGSVDTKEVTDPSGNKMTITVPSAQAQEWADNAGFGERIRAVMDEIGRQIQLGLDAIQAKAITWYTEFKAWWDAQDWTVLQQKFQEAVVAIQQKSEEMRKSILNVFGIEEGDSLGEKNEKVNQAIDVGSTRAAGIIQFAVDLIAGVLDGADPKTADTAKAQVSIGIFGGKMVEFLFGTLIKVDFSDLSRGIGQTAARAIGFAVVGTLFGGIALYLSSGDWKERLSDLITGTIVNIGEMIYGWFSAIGDGVFVAFHDAIADLYSRMPDWMKGVMPPQLANFAGQSADEILQKRDEAIRPSSIFGRAEGAGVDPLGAAAGSLVWGQGALLNPGAALGQAVAKPGDIVNAGRMIGPAASAASDAWGSLTWGSDLVNTSPLSVAGGALSSWLMPSQEEVSAAAAATTVSLSDTLRANLTAEAAKPDNPVSAFVSSMLGGAAAAPTTTTQAAAVGAPIAQGISQGATAELDKGGFTFFGDLMDKAKEFFGIQSPSTLFDTDIGQPIGLGIMQGIQTILGGGTQGEGVQSMLSGVYAAAIAETTVFKLNLQVAFLNMKTAITGVLDTTNLEWQAKLLEGYELLNADFDAFAVDWIEVRWPAMTEALIELLDTFKQGAVDKIKEMAEDVLKEVDNLVQALKSEDMIAKWNAAGADIGRALVDGMIDSFGDEKTDEKLKTAGEALINAVVAALRAAGLIDSPSKLMAEEIGAPLAAGVAVGMAGEDTVLRTAGGKMIDYAISGATDALRQTTLQAARPVASMQSNQQAVREARGGNTYVLNLTTTPQLATQASYNFAILETFYGN